MNTNKDHGGFKLYKSYSFTDKDPIIDRVRTCVDDSGLSYGRVAGESDVAPTTLRGWFDGKTRRPQYATVAAVLSGLGYDLQIVTRKSRVVVPYRHRKAG